MAQEVSAGRAGIFGESSGTVAQVAAGLAAVVVVGAGVAWCVGVAGFVAEVWAVAAVVMAARRVIEESFSVIVIPV